MGYFSDLQDAGVDVFVTNNSWGGPFSDLMRSAIEEHETRGIIFIAAAGNLGTDNDAIPNYPSSYPTSNILSVTGFGGGLNYNYGATSVDIAAPGWFIYGPLPDNTWDFAYGTSMAAPHAAGVMGLLRALDPSMSAYEARDWILANGDPFDQVFRPTVTNARLVARMPIVDSDGDGMANAWEGQYGLDPTDPSDAALDPDGDGLSNLEEFQAGSNPLLVDTDEDGLTDAEEVNTYGTDPAAFDSDDDGLSDREEVEVYFSDPLDVDSDDDGIPDGEEVDTFGTQPTNGRRRPDECRRVFRGHESARLGHRR